MHAWRIPRGALSTVCLAVCLLLTVVGPVAAAPAQHPLLQVRDEEAIANHIAELRTGPPDAEDTFDADNGTWDTSYGGDTSVYLRAGMLYIAVDVDGTVAWSESSTIARDFYVEVDTVHKEGALNNQFGIIFHLEDNENFLYFALGSDGFYSLQELEDNEWEMLIDWTESDVIEIGEGSENTLGILVQDTTVSLLVNDYIVDQVEDIPSLESKLALATGTYDEPGSVVAFDNFAVWLLGGREGGPRAGRPVRVPERPSATPTPEAEVTEEPATPEATPTPEPEEEAATARINAIRAEVPIVSETFDAESANWEPNLFDGADYVVDAGELQIEVTIPGALAWTLLDQRLDNFYLEVDATYLDGPDIEEHGVIFRYVDPQNFYFFAVSETSEFSLWMLKENEWQALQDWTPLPEGATAPGAPVRLGLLAEGEQFTLLVNDDIVLEFSDDTFPTGVVGLTVGTFEEAGAWVAFDNLDIWSVEAGGERTAVPDILELPTEEAGEETDVPAAAARIDEILAATPAITSDFRRDDGTWNTLPSDYSQVFYQRRALHLEITDVDWIGWSEYQEGDAGAASFTDFYAEVDTSFVQRPEGAATGLVFRLQDADNFYYYVLDPAGSFSLQKKVSGVWVELIPWTASDVIDGEEEAVNRIGVLAEGERLAVTLNGEVLAETEDPDLASGAVALMAASGAAANVEVSFDNFVLWDLAQ